MLIRGWKSDSWLERCILIGKVQLNFFFSGWLKKGVGVGEGNLTKFTERQVILLEKLKVD